MEPRIGLYIRDAKNIYQIRDENRQNTHSQGPSEFLVQCLKGPNKGRTMWVMRSTIVNGDFEVGES